MQETDKVNGIVILNTNESHLPDHYSPDSNCPDDQYGGDLFIVVLVASDVEILIFFTTHRPVACNVLYM